VDIYGPNGAQVCQFHSLLLSGLGPMRPSQILFAAHLDQARSAALELHAQFEAFVEALRLRGRTGQQVHIVVVELINEMHEASRRIKALIVKTRHAAQQQRVVVAEISI